MGLLAAPPAVLDDRLDEAPTGAHLLFPEARRRRRRRILGGLVVCTALALGLTVGAVGGFGGLFGGPPLTASGPSSGPVAHQLSPAGHAPSPGGPALCARGNLPVVPPGTKASSSLLPCDKAQNLPPALFHVTAP